MDTRWKKNRALTDRRAISPLIATLILITIAVVGGGMVYIAFSNQARSLSRITDIQVQSANIDNASGTVVISFTVKNTGTTVIDKVVVNVYGKGGTTILETSSLDPGKTGGDTAAGTDVIGTFEVNKSYVMEFSAKVGTDTVATRSLTVMVSG